MTRSWNGKALIDELAQRGWDTSTTHIERVRKWINDIQNDIVADIPQDHRRIRLKKLLTSGQEEYDLSPTIPEKPYVYTASGGSLTNGTEYIVYITSLTYDDDLKEYIESEPSEPSTAVSADATNKTLNIISTPVLPGSQDVKPINIRRRVYVSKKASTDTVHGEPLFSVDIENNVDTTLTITTEPTSTITPPSDSMVDQLCSDEIFIEGSNRYLYQNQRNKIRRFNPSGSDTGTPDAFDFVGPKKIRIYPPLSNNYVNINPDTNVSITAFLYSNDGRSTPVLQATRVNYDTNSQLAVMYDNSSNFTFDSTLCEFVNNSVQLKGIGASDQLLKATAHIQSDADYASGGVNTITLGSNTTRALNNGVWKYDMTNTDADNDYIEPTEAAADFGDVGTIRFKFTPDYSGSPSTEQKLFGAATTSGDAQNRLFLRHQTDGTFLFGANGSIGAIGTKNFGSWSPTSGTEYEIEINIDLDSGVQRLFIDGAQQGTNGTISASCGSRAYFRIGHSTSGSGTITGYVRDLETFNAIQHTSSFTDEIPRSVQIYSTDGVSVAYNTTQAMSKVRGISDTTTISGSDAVTYTINYNSTNYYFVGTTLTESDNSYSQSNTSAAWNTALSNGATEAQRTLSYFVYRLPNEIHYDITRPVDLPISAKEALYDGVIWKMYQFRDRHGQESKRANYIESKTRFLNRITRQKGRPGHVRDVNGDAYSYEV